MRQQHRHLIARCVREVDAGVGAHEAVPGLGDQDAVAAPDDALRLPQHELHVAGILVVLFGDAPGLW
jgi:hypothetical protein